MVTTKGTKENPESPLLPTATVKTDNLGYTVRKACGQMVSKETRLRLGLRTGECGKSYFDYLKSQY